MKIVLNFILIAGLFCGCAAGTPGAASASEEPLVAGEQVLVVGYARGSKYQYPSVIGQQGGIFLPTVGVIPVAGLTPNVATQKIERAVKNRYAPRAQNCHFEILRMPVSAR